LFNKLNELVSRRELIANFISRDLKVRYQGTLLGFFWSFLNPLVTMGVLAVVLSFVYKQRVEFFPIFLLIGIIAWQLHAASLVQSSRSIIDNGGLIKKIHLPREVFPISIVLANFYHFLFSSVILIVFFFVFRLEPHFIWILVPIFALFQLLFLLGISLIVSAVGVYFRDLPIIVESVMPVWYFLSPVIYPTSFIPERFLDWYMLNPMSAFLTAYRNILIDNTMPSMLSIIVAVGSSVFFFVVGLWIFGKLQKGFADQI
jgi:ABC-type polysaccharide/polyol phosphate export permease